MSHLKPRSPSYGQRVRFLQTIPQSVVPLQNMGVGLGFRVFGGSDSGGYSSFPNLPVARLMVLRCWHSIEDLPQYTSLHSAVLNYFHNYAIYIYIYIYIYD